MKWYLPFSQVGKRADVLTELKIAESINQNTIYKRILMETAMTIYQMKDVNIRNINPSTITSSDEIKIDIDLPVYERMKEYERQSNNMYFIKVGNILVKMEFSDTLKTINDCVESYLRIC